MTFSARQLTRVALFGCAAMASTFTSTFVFAQNAYNQTNLVANTAAYSPQIIDPTLVNAWGIAIRPAGLGGHFWVGANATGVSTQWVGDARGVPLFQDDVRNVTVPGPSGSLGTVTGVAFNGGSNFTVTQGSGASAITAPAKFIFGTDNGVISAWTERQISPGVFVRPDFATAKIDRSGDGTQFFGIGVDGAGGRLYAANFGVNPGMQMYDGNWNDITTSFSNTALGRNQFAGDGYQPFNVQVLGGSLYVAYAKFGTPGEEETGTSLGRLVEYNLDGSLRQVWGDGTGMNAPWGVAIAPGNFGLFSNHLLLSNFGDGTISAFDPSTHQFVDYLRNPDGTPVAIEGIWGLQFGNGESLGESNRLYFAAGPEDEAAGLFGSLSVVPEPPSALLMLLGLGMVSVFARRKRQG